MRTSGSPSAAAATRTRRKPGPGSGGATSRSASACAGAPCRTTCHARTRLPDDLEAGRHALLDQGARERDVVVGEDVQAPGGDHRPAHAEGADVRRRLRAAHGEDGARRAADARVELALAVAELVQPGRMQLRVEPERFVHLQETVEARADAADERVDRLLVDVEVERVGAGLVEGVLLHVRVGERGERLDLDEADLVEIERRL